MKNCLANTTLLISIVFALMLMATGCRPMTHLAGEVRVVEHIRERVRLDSVFCYVHDSVFVRQSGDTVYRDRFHTLYRDRLRLERDTVTWHDSLTVTMVEEVAKPLTPWQHFQIWSGRILWLWIVLEVLISVLKRCFKPL